MIWSQDQNLMIVYEFWILVCLVVNQPSLELLLGTTVYLTRNDGANQVPATMELLNPRNKSTEIFAI